MAEMDCLPSEEWRPAFGFEGRYEVSNTGNVRSVPRTVMRTNGVPMTVRGRILSIRIDDYGYRAASLKRSAYSVNMRTHDVGRLVALSFGVITPDQEVDHHNRIRTDDKLSNLRPATRSQNTANRSRQSNNTSGVTGVVWDKSRGQWAARVEKDGVLHNLGRFANMADAIKARNEGAVRLHGEYAVLVKQF